jgi:hypothetical protein
MVMQYGRISSKTDWARVGATTDADIDTQIAHFDGAIFLHSKTMVSVKAKPSKSRWSVQIP